MDILRLFLIFRTTLQEMHREKKTVFVHYIEICCDSVVMIMTVYLSNKSLTSDKKKPFWLMI